jgi:acetyl-CoA carboxylase, biotin carboxylase subunit
VIERLGDKAQARELARAANVPIIPGTPVLQSDSEALKSGAAIGYPLMVKASAGGGGKGIRIVHNDQDLIGSLRMAQQEASSAFGSPDVYLEKYLEEPRHIEVQILADEHGQVVHLGERDCSLQTVRHQKMLEEAPSSMPPNVRAKLGEAAVRAAKAAGYTNAGTFEFLVDRSHNFYFLEANTRLQVEHPVTEAITRLDLVKQQILIADGQKLAFSQRDIRFEGHSIECRITAEDPERNFAPSAGPIRSVVLPGGPGVRVDSHIYSGYTVPSYYDSLLAKVIVWAPDRREAISRMARCLDEMQVDGIRTTLPFYMRVMNNAWFRRGEVYTNFVRRRMEE